AICDGETTITTTGSSFLPSNDPVLSVWDACPGDGGVEIACDDDSGVDLQAAISDGALITTLGEDYFIRVAGFENNTGDITLNIATVDDCVIEGVCYLEGELNPTNSCQVCLPAVSSSTWSNLAEGTACGDPSDTVCDSPDACDGNGVCETNPKPDGTACPDEGNECTLDLCGGGQCTHPPTQVGTVCGDQSDTECDHPDSCDGAGACLDNFETAGVACGDPTQTQCDRPDVCDGAGQCDDNLQPTGFPCDDSDVCTGNDICDGGSCAGTPIAEAPIVVTEGPKSVSVVPQPVTTVPDVALLVTSPDWPCLSKYVGWRECGGNGKPCATNADCNVCTFGNTPCLSDADCDFGRCANGDECSLAAQNCTDLSTCVRIDFCAISGDLCESTAPVSIDVNLDGVIDGVRGVLVDDPAEAVVMSAADWTAGVLRCSKSAAPCTVDTDCDRGACSVDGAFCSVSAQDCLNGSTCVLDESCLPGRVFLVGDDLVPGTTYHVAAECGSFTSPAGSGSTCLWADVTCDGFVNVTDVQLLQLGFQGIFMFATLPQLDIDPCTPQGILNVTDIQRVILAIQGQTYEEVGCPVPCP
ncbi:MAG: hypothetical protein ACE5HE_15085, partial [Phycisphaerae bacterium]